LDDKPLFDRAFRQGRFETAESCFTTLYMWRNAFSIERTVVDGFLCCKACRDGRTFLLPPYPLEPEALAPEALGRVLMRYQDYFRQLGLPFLMKGVPRAAAEKMRALLPASFVCLPDRDHFDYVYLRQDLAELKGRRYHGKRNHIKVFEATYPDHEFFPITPDLIQDCIGFADEWCRRRNCGDNADLAYERDAIVDVLEHFSLLGVTGLVLTVGGRIEAFSFGEPLNSDTIVVHAEKGNAEIRGIYQMINREFCRIWPAEYVYVNREEDMGVPGLREAKRSYHPVMLVEKYVVAAEWKADTDG